MGRRGPKSAAELSIVGGADAEIVSIARPEPPDSLTPEQADIWRAIVAALPPEDIPSQRYEDLANYCRHAVSQRVIAKVINELERQIGAPDFELERYDRALKVRERETRAISSLSVRLGFAYSTAYDKKKPKSGAVRKPLRYDW
jgi:hypothetical protein